MKNKTDNQLGKGIATAGIWLGLAYAAPHLMFFTVLVAIFAMFATIAIWD